MIGVFGDSFADINPIQYIDRGLDRMPWALWLEKISGIGVAPHGVSATSIWYSYKKFLDNYKKYDTIVFCYSDLHRWPNINDPEGMHRGLHHIRYRDQLNIVPPEDKQTAAILINAYELLHDWDLDKFLFQSIFNSVNSLCDEANIKLVNILNFEEINDQPLSIDISSTKNAVLTNLVQVSGNEYSNVSPNSIHMQIAKLIKEKPDKRFCHLNTFNNKVLAEIVYSCITDSVGYINLGKDDRFSYDMEHLRYLLYLE